MSLLVARYTSDSLLSVFSSDEAFQGISSTSSISTVIASMRSGV